MIGFDPRQRQRIVPLSSLSRPTVGHTQPHVRWVPGILSPWIKRGRGVTLTTHPHLVPRSRMCRSYISSPPSASMACSGTALPLSVKILIDYINQPYFLDLPQYWQIFQVYGYAGIFPLLKLQVAPPPPTSGTDLSYDVFKTQAQFLTPRYLE
jgi:hypothetical protein